MDTRRRPPRPPRPPPCVSYCSQRDRTQCGRFRRCTFVGKAPPEGYRQYCRLHPGFKIDRSRGANCRILVARPRRGRPATQKIREAQAIERELGPGFDETNVRVTRRAGAIAPADEQPSPQMRKLLADLRDPDKRVIGEIDRFRRQCTFVRMSSFSLKDALALIGELPQLPHIVVAKLQGAGNSKDRDEVAIVRALAEVLPQTNICCLNIGEITASAEAWRRLLEAVRAPGCCLGNLFIDEGKLKACGVSKQSFVEAVLHNRTKEKFKRAAGENQALLLTYRAGWRETNFFKRTFESD